MKKDKIQAIVDVKQRRSYENTMIEERNAQQKTVSLLLILGMKENYLIWLE